MRPSTRRIFWRIAWPHCLPLASAVIYVAFSRRFDLIDDWAIICYSQIALSIILFWFVRLHWIHSNAAKSFLTRCFPPVGFVAQLCTLILLLTLAALLFSPNSSFALRADFVTWGFVLFGGMEGVQYFLLKLTSSSRGRSDHHGVVDMIGTLNSVKMLDALGGAIGVELRLLRQGHRQKTILTLPNEAGARWSDVLTIAPLYVLSWLYLITACLWIGLASVKLLARTFAT